MCEVLDRVESRGIQKGIIQGENKILSLMNYLLFQNRMTAIFHHKILSLMNYLLSNNRVEDAKKASGDKTYRNKLFTEVFGDKL